jgi:hypothetical protein
VVELEQINLNGVALPCELLKAILMGLASNQQTPSLSLNLEATIATSPSDRAQCCAVLETGLPSISVHSLSLRDNGLETEMAQLISAVARMPKLTHLDVGGANLIGLRRHPKNAVNLTNVLLELVKLIGDEECVSLSLID